jgi:hypothetical protein
MGEPFVDLAANALDTTQAYAACPGGGRLQPSTRLGTSQVLVPESARIA